jgi:excisionase family DNA binding protein
MTNVTAESALSTGQAARALGVSSQWILHWCKVGRLPSTITALGRLIPAEAVEQLREERTETEEAAG